MSFTKICCITCIIIIAFFLFLPSLISTKLGTKTLTYVLEKKFAKKVQLSDLHLSWFGKQKISQLEIIDYNQLWFSSPEITIDTPLISLVLFHKLHNLIIVDPKLVWEEKMPISSYKKNPYTALYFVYAFDGLEIRNGSFTGVFLTYPNIGFDQINLKWDRKKDTSSLVLEANSLQNQTQGFVKLQSNFLFPEKTAFLSLQSEHFPCDLFAYIFDLPASWLGSSFSTQADLKLIVSPKQIGNISGHLDFVLAKAAQIKGSADVEATFSIKEHRMIPLTLTTTCTNIPTELLTLFTQDSSINSLMGDVFDLKLDIDGPLYAFDLSSPLLKMQGNAHWDKNKAQLLADAIPISFTLTQENYAFIRSLIKLPSLTLVEPSLFQGVINQILVGTKNIGFFPLLNFRDLSFNATFINEKVKVAFQEKTSLISSLQIKTHVSEDLFSSQIQADILDKKQGSFFSDISWKKQAQDLNVEVRCQAVPSYLLEGLFPQISLQTLLGPSIDATLHTKLVARNGPLSIEILSPYFSFSLEGKVARETITLSKPFYCQMNKEAGDYARKKIFPFFSFLQPKNPISIKIAAGETIGFSYPFSSTELSIPTAEIEIGKTLCYNQSVSRALLNLLKIHKFDVSLQFALWIAPIRMHINKGLIDLERVEMLLADLYEIAIWGKVDVKNNIVRMKVGLPASTLSKAFNIPNLSDDYVLALKLEGDLKNPQIDIKKAAAKIAALFICQQEHKNPLNIFFPSCKPLQKTPIPPAKHPFPWEQTTALLIDKKRKRFTEEDKPLKQLLKVLR